MQNNTLISLRNVSVDFDGDTVLDRINLDINDKEFVTLLGPSGCGKTTTLRIIGGFVEPTEGDIFFDGKRSTDFRLIRGRSIPFFSGMRYSRT